LIAGYEVATTSKPDDWPEDPTAFEFELAELVRLQTIRMLLWNHAS
jgi:hypothetical protein